MPAAVGDADSEGWVLSMGNTTTCGCETVVKFTSEGQKSRQPLVASASSGGHFHALSINNLLCTVNEQDVSSTYFKSKIDDIAVLEGGYVAVGEQSGILSVGVFEEEFRVQQSCNMMDNNKSEGCSFKRILFQVMAEDEERSEVRVICLLCNGQLMTLSHLVLQNGGIDLSKVKMERISASLDVTHDVVVTQDRIIAVGAGTDCVAVYGMEDGQLILEDTLSVGDDAEMIRVHTLHTAGFVTLDSKGKFYLWDDLTLSVVHTWTLEDVTDFKLVEVITDRPFSTDDVKLVVIQGDKVRTLNLSSLALSFECGGGADHIKLSKALTTQDEIYVTECCTVEDEDGIETTVYFRSYAETSPQKRLQRLIAKRRFEEAEQLAKLYGLSYTLEPVVIQSKMREAKETFAETLSNIKHCKQQLHKNKSGDPSVRQVMEELQEIEHRLESYCLVYGEENYSAMEWEMFQYENPLTLSCQLLMIDAEKAFTLWRCFQNELQKLLKPGMIHQILERIPNTVPAKLVSDWLCDAIIPDLVVKDPAALTSIIQWIDDQVNNLEAQNSSKWPDDAIQLCESLLHSLDQAVACDVDDVTDNNIHLIKMKIKCAQALSPLQNLIKCLVSLKELRTKYNCHFTLEVCRKETLESIVFRMLDRVVAVDLLPVTLRDQVLPYIKHHGLVADEIFAKYVKDLLEKSAASCHQYSWEEKVKAIVRVITDPKEKVVAVLNLLDSVRLPLSEFVEGLVAEVIGAVQHPLVAALKEKWSIKEADNIVHSYGLNPNEVKSPSQVKEVAKYIVASDGALSDAYKVLTAHKICLTTDDSLPKFMCRLFVERNQIEKLAEHLRSLPVKCARACCNFVISTARCMMVDGEDHMAQDMKQLRLQYFEAALKATTILKSFTDNLLEIEEIEENVKPIMQARELEVHHNTLVNEENLEDKERCTEIFSASISKLPCMELMRHARLLNLSGSDTVSAVISHLADTCDCPDTARILRTLSKASPDIKLSYSVLHDIMSLTKAGDSNIPDLCIRLAQLLSAYCSADQTKFLLKVCQLASLTKDIYILSQDSEGKEQWDPSFFTESSSALDSEMVLSDVVQALLELISLSNEIDFSESLTQLESVAQYLCTVGHHQLATRVAVLGLSWSQAAILQCDDIKMTSCMDALGKLHEVAHTTTTALIPKILNYSPLDGQLALAYVAWLPRKQSVSLLQSAIRSCGSNYKKLKRVCIVACATAEMMGDQKLIDSCHRVKVVAKWGSRLSKIGIPFKGGSVGSVSEALEAVNKLVHNPQCDVAILQEYFRDFGIDISGLESVLVRFFEALLMRHSEGGLSPAMLRKAKDILRYVGDNDLKMLRKLLNKTHSYNYEVLQFLLEEIKAREETPETLKGLELLRYLRIYTRCSAPTSLEKKQWDSNTGIKSDGDHGHLSDLDVLPEIATTRLPFHHLMDKDRWEIISAEVNSSTLSVWLDMASVLEISRDNLRLKAASNMTADYLASSTSTGASSCTVSQDFHTFLGQIHKVLAAVEQKEKAMWCCHAILDKLTDVGEKTVALQGCIMFANKWLSSAEKPQEATKAQKVIDMFTRKFQVLSCHWALSKAGLGSEGEAKKLLKQPEELIQYLYSLPCVGAGDDEDKDINSLCDGIADLHKINLLELRTSLLDRWLLGSSAIMDPDQTMTFDVVSDEASDKDNLKRAIYLMMSRDKGALLNHVASIVNSNQNEGIVNPETHRRALYCMLKIASEEEMGALLNL